MTVAPDARIHAAMPHGEARAYKADTNSSSWRYKFTGRGVRHDQATPDPKLEEAEVERESVALGVD